MIRLRHEGTQTLPAGVSRGCLKFAGILMGNKGKVSAALVKAVTGPRSMSALCAVAIIAALARDSKAVKDPL